MTLTADSKGRLTSAELFKPGKSYDVAPMPDGGVRVIELVERQVPTVKVKFSKDGKFECRRLMTREQIAAAIRADRDAR
jgi:hypothetical protein